MAAASEAIARDTSAGRFGAFGRFLPFLEWLPMLKEPGTLRTDILAGIAAGILILPQAIALATMAGLPPEIGLYTAIYPVIVCALFGSSWHALAGPNTSISVVVVFIIGGYASEGVPDYIMYMITLTFMVGVAQVATGMLRLGAVFNYFSHTVMVAMVTGVGITIIIQQVGNFLGLLVNTGEPIEDTVLQMIESFPRANWYATFLGVLTVAAGLLVKKYRPKWPYVIIAVAVGMIAAEIMHLVVPPAISRIDELGYLSLEMLPLSAPDFSPTNFYEAAEGLVMGSMMVAFLGLMQSAVIARSMAVKSGQHVDMNQEVIGQGVSNIVGSFLSCYPSCGSFNRSAANLETGARTPLAGIVSAFALAALVYFAAPVIAHMPLSVMAGILFLVGAGLVKIKDIKHFISIRGETRIVFLLILGTTLYGGLQNAVFLGIFLSIVVYMRAISKPEMEILASEEVEQYVPDDKDPENTMVLQLAGSLFFGSTPALERTLSDIAKQDNLSGTLVIAAEYMDQLDPAGAGALVTEVAKRREKGGDLYLWLRNHNLDKVLRESGLLTALGSDHVIYTLDTQPA